MVGVPALAMWTWGPSSRICWPMLFLISHRISTGVDRTATHRARPPDVIREINGDCPRARAEGPSRLDPVVEGPGPTSGRPGWTRGPSRPGAPRRPARRARWPVRWPGPGRPRPPPRRRRSTRSGSRSMMAIGSSDLGIVRGQDDHDRPGGTTPRPSRAVCPGHGLRHSRTGRPGGRTGQRPGPRSAPPPGRPGCGRSRPGPRTADPRRRTSMRPGTGPAAARPAATGPRRSRGPATAAAIRALSTLNPPVSGDRHRPIAPPERGPADRGHQVAGVVPTDRHEAGPGQLGGQPAPPRVVAR